MLRGGILHHHFLGVHVFVNRVKLELEAFEWAIKTVTARCVRERQY
jgi:hypothetical protein